MKDFILSNGNRTEWPYTWRRLLQDNPNISFSTSPVQKDLEPYGVYIIHPTTPPDYNSVVQRLVEVQPTFVDGKWMQAWSVESLPPAPAKADWVGFKSGITSSEITNSEFKVALDKSPLLVSYLPIALDKAADQGLYDDFVSTWVVARRQKLFSQTVLDVVANLATACNLPEEFTKYLGGSRPEPTELGQEWVSHTGEVWRAVQARDQKGQFVSDNPSTPQRESLEWRLEV